MIFENIEKYRRHLRNRQNTTIKKLRCNISAANYARCKEIDILLTKIEMLK